MDKQDYTLVLDSVVPNRPKCKCCGGDIFYDNSDAHISNRGNLIINGKSYRTTKTVNGVDYSLQVCQECLLKQFPSIKNLSRTFNVMSEQTAFAFDISDEVFSSSRKKYAMTKAHMIEKYGEDEGLKKWKKYCDRQAETNTFEYKHKKYGMTKDEFRDYNMSRAVTKENLIKRYGEDEGLKKWESYINAQIKTKSLSYMIEKYGEEYAHKINKSKAITKEHMIEKYGVVEGSKKWAEYCINRKNNYSEVSQAFFRTLDSFISHKYKTQYATKNGEKSIKTSNGITYFLDYFIPELNIDVEFNGACFHGDPLIYKPEDHCFPYNQSITAADLIKRDKVRYETLEREFGIKTIVVWDSEYTRNFNFESFIKNKLNIDIDTL